MIGFVLRTRGLALAGLMMGVILGSGRSASGQEPIPASVPTLDNPVYAAPGNYGMAWGSPSYGLKRTYSEFSSPYGRGYGYGYPPTGFLPGRHGVGLWRPDFVESGTIFGGPNSYRTFAVPYTPGKPVWTPPVGAYAPALGPSR
ncbi:MAG: hypothetical protein U0794_10840 [Isosphaeraceae bacterium]